MALDVLLSEQQAAGLVEVFALLERGQQLGRGGGESALPGHWEGAREAVRIIGAQLACQPAQGTLCASEVLERWAQVMGKLDTPGTWETFTCQELEATADLARAAGREDVAGMMIHLHALGDYDQEDQHHELYLQHQRDEQEWTMPGKPEDA